MGWTQCLSRTVKEQSKNWLNTKKHHVLCWLYLWWDTSYWCVISFCFAQSRSSELIIFIIINFNYKVFTCGLNSHSVCLFWRLFGCCKLWWIINVYLVFGTLIHKSEFYSQSMLYYDMGQMLELGLELINAALLLLIINFWLQANTSCCILPCQSQVSLVHKHVLCKVSSSRCLVIYIS